MEVIEAMTDEKPPPKPDHFMTNISLVGLFDEPIELSIPSDKAYLLREWLSSVMQICPDDTLTESKDKMNENFIGHIDTLSNDLFGGDHSSYSVQCYREQQAEIQYEYDQYLKRQKEQSAKQPQP